MDSENMNYASNVKGIIKCRNFVANAAPCNVYRTRQLEENRWWH